MDSLIKNAMKCDKVLKLYFSNKLNTLKIESLQDLFALHKFQVDKNIKILSFPPFKPTFTVSQHENLYLFPSILFDVIFQSKQGS